MLVENRISALAQFSMGALGEKSIKSAKYFVRQQYSRRNEMLLQLSKPYLNDPIPELYSRLSGKVGTLYRNKFSQT
jgi:hypothetical protein